MNDFIFGVIEGFYGRPWSWQARAETVDFLQHEQFNSYVYAPKSDRQLRRAWREPHPSDVFENLLALRANTVARAVFNSASVSAPGVCKANTARPIASNCRKNFSS